MRFSQKRKLILDIILNSDGHLTPDFIYGELKNDYPELSFGTVYRNLAQLAENKFIKKINLENKSNIFDKNLEEHGHLICKKCNSIYDIDLKSLKKEVQNLSESNDFLFNSYDITFHGICKKCKLKKKKSK